MRDGVSPSYLDDRDRVARMARTLRGLDDPHLNNALVRRHAYDNAGALHGLAAGDYDRMDRLAVAAERARQRAFGEATR